MSVSQINNQMLHALNEKVDNIITAQNTLASEYKADMKEVKEKMANLVIEDIRIDNKFTLVASNTKAYIAGIATAFTFLGTVFGAAMTYIFGVK